MALGENQHGDPPAFSLSVEGATTEPRDFPQAVWTSAGWTDLEKAREWSYLRLLDPEGLPEDHLARILLHIEQSSVPHYVVGDCLQAGLSLGEVAQRLEDGSPDELAGDTLWFACGFEPDEVPEWENVSGVFECAFWKDEGFGPVDTSHWLADFDKPEDATQWREQGFIPARAAWYRSAHIDLDEAVDFEVRRAGGEDILGVVLLLGGLRGGTIDMTPP